MREQIRKEQKYNGALQSRKPEKVLDIHLTNIRKNLFDGVVASYFVFQTRITKNQWIGLLLGLVGVALVVGQHISFDAKYRLGVLMSFLGLFGLTLGNIYQKRFCSSMNIFTGGVIQSFVSCIMCLILAAFFEPMKIVWAGQFIVALLWMSVIVSVGAISLLYVLLEKGESHKVASLFYLMPVVAAIISYLIFKTTLSAVQIIGMTIASLGVFMVNIQPSTKSNCNMSVQTSTENKAVSS